MILMPPNPLALEQRREPKPRVDLALMHNFIAIFRLADNEFTDLCFISILFKKRKGGNVPATPYP